MTIFCLNLLLRFRSSSSTVLVIFYSSTANWFIWSQHIKLMQHSKIPAVSYVIVIWKVHSIPFLQAKEYSFKIIQFQNRKKTKLTNKLHLFYTRAERKWCFDIENLIMLHLFKATVLILMTAVFTATVWSRSRDLGSTTILVGRVVTSLDQALYDDYLCLVASNKQ